MNNILKTLEEQHMFSNSEKELANYILKNKEKVLNMSVRQLAQNTYTSTSTIVRMCRKINLKGYKEFKIKFSAELQKTYNDISDVDADFPFTDNDSYIEISKKICELSNESLNHTYQMISNDLIEEIVQLIKNSNRIAIISIGDAYLRALEFQNRLMKIKINVILTPIPDENDHLAYSLDKEDCAIIITYSGENKRTVEMAKLMKRNKVKIITITSNTKSHIGRISDVVFPLPNKESQSIKFSTFASQVAIEYALSVIYAALFVTDYDKNQETRIKEETWFLNTKYQMGKK